MSGLSHCQSTAAHCPLCTVLATDDLLPSNEGQIISSKISGDISVRCPPHWPHSHSYSTHGKISTNIKISRGWHRVENDTPQRGTSRACRRGPPGVSCGSRGAPSAVTRHRDRDCTAVHYNITTSSRYNTCQQRLIVVRVFSPRALIYPPSPLATQLKC